MPIWTDKPPTSAGLWWGVNRASGLIDLVEVTEEPPSHGGGMVILVHRWQFGRTTYPTGVWSLFAPVTPPAFDAPAPRDVGAESMTTLKALCGDPEAPGPGPAAWPDGTPVAQPEMVTLPPDAAQPPCVRHGDAGA